MRVIAGSLKGRILGGPKGGGVRPTSDRLRETLFNIVDVAGPGYRFLDAYAGTGAVGIEAVSRGATAVTFVERDPIAAGVIRENVSRCGVSDACTIVCGDFLRLGSGGALAPPFDLVFLDPPYGHPDLPAVLAEAGRAVRDGGLVALEHSRRDQAPEQSDRLVRRRTVAAGDGQITFYGVTAAISS